MKKNQSGLGKTSLFGSTDEPSNPDSVHNRSLISKKDLNTSGVMVDGSMNVNHSRDSIMMQSTESNAGNSLIISKESNGF